MSDKALERRSTWVTLVYTIIATLAVVIPGGIGVVNAQIDAKMDAKLAPLSGAMQAIIQQNIDRLKRDIARMKNKERVVGLTDEESRELIDKQIELEGQERALAPLTK